MATADHANDLAERLRNGDIDPAEIDLQAFIDDDLKAMTPELWQELDEDQRERYNELRAEADREVLAEEAIDREAKHEAAIAAIREPTEEGTGTVQLGDIEVTVRNYLNGRIERKMSKLEAAEGQGDIDLARETTIDILTWLVVEPEEYTNPEVWREYAETYGTLELQRQAIRLSEPYRKRTRELSDVESFRGE